MSSKRSAPARISVTPDGHGWSVRGEASAGREARTFATESDALHAAQELVRENGGEIIIRRIDGRARDSFTLGRAGMRKLAAVEGLTVTREMVRQLEEFDRRGLSPQERRAELASRFRKGGR
jgi:hypothetical protein